MNSKIEQIYGTLELLIDKLSFDLPGHEDGGYIYPFAWSEATQGEFNVFNLCQENSWLKLTDRQNIINSWRQLESARCFNAFSLTPEQIQAWKSNIDSLALIIKDLSNLEAYQFQKIPYGNEHNILIGRVNNNTWVGIAPTVYVETDIPQEVIARYTKYSKNTIDYYGNKASEFDTKVKAIITKLGTIELNGDFGGGYYYSHSHKIVYAFGKTKELAFRNTLQKTGMLEVSKFASLYCDRQYLNNYYPDNNTENKYQKYSRINQFLSQTFSDVKVYRLASGISENIYLLGKINKSDKPNGIASQRVGIYLKSYFVYNP